MAAAAVGGQHRPPPCRRLWELIRHTGLGLGHRHFEDGRLLNPPCPSGRRQSRCRVQTSSLHGTSRVTTEHACLRMGCESFWCLTWRRARSRPPSLQGFGQFDDPETSGVAHLTEHLLLSSPGPNGAEPLETWLEEPARDGDSNGFTAFDNALFTVSSNMNEWRSALARFAHCFRPATPDDARFQASAVQRECAQS